MKPRSPVLDIRPIVNRVVDLIEKGADDECLKWSKDRKRVTVRVSKLIPDLGPKQTVTNRRRRLANALYPALSELGWHSAARSTSHIFERTEPASE